MRYQYVKPVAERHEVVWYLHETPGIYGERKQHLFAHAELCTELTTWLDDNAPGWTFRSDGDHDNGGDDYESCLLRVSNKEEGEGFVEQAKRISTAWVAADRAAMRNRVVLVEPSGEAVELMRGHSHVRSTSNLERRLRGHFRFDEQPHRSSVFRAMNWADVEANRRKDEESFEIEVEFGDGDRLIEGTRLLIVRVAAGDAS
jgi:hypothetical protein